MTYDEKWLLNWLVRCEIPYLHLVRRFWNQVLTCASVIFRLLARAARSALARYFCRWKRFSSSQIWTLEKEVRGFFRFGGVRFWYGCPIRRVTANGTRAAEADKTNEFSGERKIRFHIAANGPNALPICMEIQGHISQKSFLFDNYSLFRPCKPV